MEIGGTETDEAVLLELGKRIRAARIGLNWSQQRLADESGIAKRTLERIEQGYPTQTTNLIRILRVLDVLPSLNLVLPEAGASPLARVQQARKPARKRAGRSQEGPSDPWTWGEGP